MVAERILVATDESSDGKHAVRAAEALAAATPARVTVITVLPASGAVGLGAGALLSTDPTLGRTGPSPQLQHFRDWLGNGRGARNHGAAAVAFGVPGIEILRVADLVDADLIVLGRRPRSPEQRHVLGETADAVVRRSNRPVLFVSAEADRFRHVLVALDGTERAPRVLEQAHRLATELGARLSAVTVEPALEGESAERAGSLPRSRSVRLGDAIRRLAHGKDIELEVRRGNPIEEVLACCSELRPDALVIGYRRGGPPKVMGPTDIARNLLYAAPCSVYTVPL